MVILHIAKTLNRPFSGVDVVVPKYIQHQQEQATVGVINVTNIEIKGAKNQFRHDKNFNLSGLPNPFSKPDIIVFHQLYRVEFLTIAKQARKEKIPYIIIPHGGLTKFAQNVRWLKKRVGNILFFNRFLKKAKAIQYLSIGEKDMSAKKLPSILSTNGIDIPDKKKTCFHENEMVFTYIGRYDMYVKGLDLLLEAINQKKDLLRKNNAKINLYGPYTAYSLEDRNKLKQLIAQYDIEDLVSINEAILDNEKETVLLNTDIYIQCSRTEAMGLSIAEALSYGIPAFVTQTTTMGDIIQEYNAGWSCNASVNSIAETFEKAINEKELYFEKSKKAEKLAEENYSWDKCMSKMIENYQNMLR